MDIQEYMGITEESLVNTFLEVIHSQGVDFIKKQSLSLVTEIGLESSLSLIPAIGSAISSYRTNRAIKNIEIQVQQIAEQADAIQRNLSIMSVEVRQELDKLFLYMLEKTVNEKQEQKIQYFTNAFVNLTAHSEIDVDISYIYFDTLEQLTHLDIKVLVEISKSPVYYYFNPDEETDNSFTSEQQQAIKSNLHRLGLAENEFDKTLGKDLEDSNAVMEEIRKAVIELQEFTSNPKKKINSIKNKSKAKVSKVKARDKIKVSKFGREMIEFFKEQEAVNETSI
ncbi:hypothetical protein ACEE76_05215 [Streptococcus hyovaginalis]